MEALHSQSRVAVPPLFRGHVSGEVEMSLKTFKGHAAKHVGCSGRPPS